MKAENIQKKEALEMWRGVADSLPLTPEPIAYKHRGSTIDEDGVRICGSREFILSVMSRLKPLLAFENGETRIGIAFSEIVDKETQEVISGKFRCSIQVHERGDEAKAMNRMCARFAAKRGEVFAGF
tara:strand:+ start:395 stop:775 length:381 start_codon:yes stop_codon:yes gene_type:complete